MGRNTYNKPGRKPEILCSRPSMYPINNSQVRTMPVIEDKDRKMGSQPSMTAHGLKGKETNSYDPRRKYNSGGNLRCNKGQKRQNEPPGKECVNCPGRFYREKVK